MDIEKTNNSGITHITASIRNTMLNTMFVDVFIWFRDCPLFSCFATWYTSFYIILFSLSILLTIQFASRIVPQLQIAWKNDAAAVCPIGAVDWIAM